MRTVLCALGLMAFAVIGVVGLPGSKAAAGGMDQLYPVQDRYEPGDTATMVGYTVRSTDPQVWEHADPDVLDWSDTGPFHGYLRADSRGPQGGPIDRSPGVLPTDIDLGEPAVQATDGLGEYGAVRVSLTFSLPADLQAGAYLVGITDQWGSRYLGHLDASWIHVGVHPSQTVIRAWPHDEPSVDDLDPDALLWDSDLSGTVTAAEVWSGEASLTPTEPAAANGPGRGDGYGGTDRPSPRSDGTDDQDERSDPDDVIATDERAGGAAGDGIRIGGVMPWFVAFAALVGMWCVAWRLGGGRRGGARGPAPTTRYGTPPSSGPLPEREPMARHRRAPRKRVSTPAWDTDHQTGVPSDEPVRFRL